MTSVVKAANVADEDKRTDLLEHSKDLVPSYRSRCKSPLPPHRRKMHRLLMSVWCTHSKVPDLIAAMRTGTFERRFDSISSPCDDSEKRLSLEVAEQYKPCESQRRRLHAFKYISIEQTR